MGSKNKIAIDLLQAMLKEKPKAKYFFDLCGGGGAMSFTASQLGLKTHYNDLQANLVDFINYIFDRIHSGKKGKYGIFPDDFYNFITRAEFVKLKNENSIKAQFARIVYSFGNNQQGYLFCEDKEKIKQVAHNLVMFQCKKSAQELSEVLKQDITISQLPTWNERRLEFRKQICREKRSYKELQQLEQLQQLERLVQLVQLERLEQLVQLEPIFTTSSKSYNEVEINTPIDETIVYIDPPYKKTGKYIEGKNFDYSQLYNWFKNNKYTCFMSEYEAPFKAIFEIKKASLMNNSRAKQKVVKEKLYINK